jgi:ribosomal protein S27AE
VPQGGADDYLKGKPCPKCGYVRTAADMNPAWQCPKCRIAYMKFPPRAARLSTRLAAGGRELAQEASEDSSVLVLIAANLAALAIAWWIGMSLRELMLVYWIQSVIIGVMSFIRILSLDRFDPSNLNIGNRPVQETAGDKLKIAGFFLLHYGFFHFGYLVFVLSLRSQDGGSSAIGYLLCALVFFANHGYSLLKNVRQDAHGRPHIGTLMFLPYARIVPMHLTILFGGTFFAGAFTLFGGLKVLADVAMHTLEHHVLRASREAS